MVKDRIVVNKEIVCNISAAIVRQACVDYIHAKRILKEGKFSKTKLNRAKGDITEIKSFFNSEWYMVLCDLDSKWLLERLDRLV